MNLCMQGASLSDRPYECKLTKVLPSLEQGSTVAQMQLPLSQLAQFPLIQLIRLWAQNLISPCPWM